MCSFLIRFSLSVSLSLCLFFSVSLSVFISVSLSLFLLSLSLFLSHYLSTFLTSTSLLALSFSPLSMLPLSHSLLLPYLSLSFCSCLYLSLPSSHPYYSLAPPILSCFTFLSHYFHKSFCLSLSLSLSLSVNLSIYLLYLYFSYPLSISVLLPVLSIYIIKELVLKQYSKFYASGGNVAKYKGITGLPKTRGRES